MEYWLSSQAFSVRTEERCADILGLYLAFDNTIVLITQKVAKKSIQLLHIRLDGKELGKTVISDTFPRYPHHILVMINDHTVAFLIMGESAFKIICLKTYKQTIIKTSSTFSRRSKIFYFQQKGIICIINAQISKFSYYSSSGSFIRQICVKVNGFNQTSYFKGDSLSLIILQSYRNPFRKIHIYTIDQTIPKTFELPINQLNINIGNIWLTQPFTLRFIGRRYLTSDYSCYDYDLRTTQLTKTLFRVSSQEIKIWWAASFQKHSIYFFSTSQFPTLSKVIIIHNETSKTTQIPNLTFRLKDQFPSCSYRNGKFVIPNYYFFDKSIEVTVLTHMVEKDIYLLFMLHVNEDFDDDLLFDAIELLQQ